MSNCVHSLNLTADYPQCACDPMGTGSQQPRPALWGEKQREANEAATCSLCALGSLSVKWDNNSMSLRRLSGGLSELPRVRQREHMQLTSGT